MTVTSHPYYELPQELCLSFDCFSETTVVVSDEGVSSSYSGPPIERVAYEFKCILQGLAESQDSLASAIVGAANFYHTALSLIGFDPSGAYVALVSAIECLAGQCYKSLGHAVPEC